MSGAVDSAPARWKTIAVSGFIVATLSILWVSTFNPIMGVAPDRDSGIFLYVGQQLLRGQALYRDLFDDKGPLVYLFNALGLAVGGGSMWGVYVLGIALLCLVVVLVFFGFQRRFGFRAGAAGALYCALLLGVFAYGDNAEGFVLLAQLTALFLLTRWRPDDPRLFPYVMLGVAGAATFFIKMTGVGLWLALFAAETLIALKSSEWRVYRRHMVSLAAGAGLGAAVVLSYLAATGSLAGFFRVYFAFNAVYASQHRLVDRLNSLFQGIQFLGYVAVACFAGIWIVMLVRVATRWRHGDTPDLLMLLALVWFPLEFVIASMPGRGSRYFATVLPAMVLLFGLACSEVARSQPWHRPVSGKQEGRRAALLGVFALVAAISLAPALLRSLHNLGGAVLHRSEYTRTRPGAVYAGSCYPKVVDYVQQNTQPGDYVLVWGDYSQATNFLADRRTPTRFVFQPYLYDAAYGDTLVREFLSDLQERPPAMIVDTSPSWVLYAERPSIAAVQTTWPQGRPADFQAAWHRVGSYLREHYHQVETLPYTPHWKVYVRF